MFYEKIKLYMMIILLLQLPTYILAQEQEESCWDDFSYWASNNNQSKNAKLRQTDRDILTDTNESNGLYYNTYATDVNYQVSPQTVAFWAYLAELGVAIINNNDSEEAKFYLSTTSQVARAYKEKLYKGLGRGKGKLINTPWINNRKSWSLSVGDTLPFNMNASYAYFCAVRNNVNKKYNDGQELFYENSMAFNIYQYLHTQIGIFKKDGKTYVKWKYSEQRDENTADDLSHAGLAARSLAYGADFNYVWRWWTNVLFISQREDLFANNPTPGNMNFSNILESDDYAGACRAWSYNYQPFRKLKFNCYK